MRVRRDYSRSLFSSRRRRGALGARGFMVLGIVVGIFLTMVYLRFDDMQFAVLEAIGQAPSPTPYAATVATSGAELFVKGDLLGAERAFEQAVNQQPRNIDYLYEYGRVLIELEKSPDAVRIADQIISVNPDDVRGHALRANALKWTEPDKAIQDALRGIEIDANFSPLYGALAVSYTNIQRYTQALENGQKAIDLGPMDADAYRAYSWPLILVGRSSEAIEMLETAVSINPNLTGPYFQLAFEYKNRANQPAQAVAIYQHIIDNMDASDADEAKANLRICETYAGVENAQFDVAEIYCRRAIEIDPNYGSAYRELGRMQYNRRNYEGSIESFQTCARLQEDLAFKDIECWALRGLAHYWMAQCDDAWATLNEAMSMAEEQNVADSIVSIIDTGLYNVTQNCPAYVGIPTPTPIPPTRIPPTPIGSL